MSRETASGKARRYVLEGRLTLTRVTSTTVTATVRGDGARYRVGWDDLAGWSCSCPARTRCAHLLAVGLVVEVASGGAR